MVELTLRSDFDVLLIDTMGDDHRAVQAARTSTQGADALKSGEGPGLINRLAAERHGVPFEHAIMQWLMTCPLFVWREFMRHRIGWSYSEQSARYMQLLPVFYVAGLSRPIKAVPGSKRMAYEMQDATPEETQAELERDVEVFQLAYDKYQESIDAGVLPEKARTKLPVAIYSTCMVTTNLRALMHFLSLRVRAEEPEAKFPSKPQWEINRVADAMEEDFATHFPIVHAAFIRNGRVAP